MIQNYEFYRRGMGQVLWEDSERRNQWERLQAAVTSELGLVVWIGGLSSTHNLVEDCGRLHFPKMTELTHMPSHKLFFQYGIDTCPRSRGEGVCMLAPRRTWARLCNCLDERNGEEVSQHDFPHYSASSHWMLTRGPSHHAVCCVLWGGHRKRPMCRETKPPTNAEHQLPGRWANELSDDSHPQCLCSWAEAQTHVTEERKVIPTVPCPNSWPREARRRINGYFTPKV